MPVACATVDAEGAGARLDQFVARLTGVSVHEARRLIAGGRISVDGRATGTAKKGLRLTVGQRVAFDPPAAGMAPDAVIPDPDMPLAVLYCDDSLVAVNKPAGIPCHPLRPGETGTVANGLVARFPTCAGAGADPREAGLGHRLDIGTSGVLVAARHREVWRALRAALTAPGCEKIYIAEVSGRPAPQGRLEAPIGRRGRRGSQVVVGGGGRNPLPAVTTWEVLDERPSSSLLRVRLHAGRAHQVRAHLTALGHPLVGDALYGGEAIPAAAAGRVPGPARLHAASVRLRHPISGETLFIEAPPPEWGKIPSR